MARITEEMDFTAMDLLPGESKGMLSPRSLPKSHWLAGDSGLRLFGGREGSVRCYLLGILAVLQTLGLVYLLLGQSF